MVPNIVQNKNTLNQMFNDVLTAVVGENLIDLIIFGLLIVISFEIPYNIHPLQINVK